jgi:threonine dehydratase
MKTLTLTEKDPFFGTKFDALRRPQGTPDVNGTMYVPYTTPAYDKLPFQDRMNKLFPTHNQLGAYTPLRERSEVYSQARLFELDLASYSPVGSFKYRGAWNAVASVNHTALLQHGVITASAGNHGLGVAMSVRRLNELYHDGSYTSIGQERVRARIYVPSTAAPTKIEQIKNMGGDDVELVISGETYAEAYRQAVDHARFAPNSTLIHPYDDDAVIAGQSTVGIDVVKQLRTHNLNPSVTTIVVPVGGGGLLAGVVDALRRAYPNPNDRPFIVGAQLEGSDSAALTWAEYRKTGQVTPLAVDGNANLFADGAAVQQVGDRTARYLPYVDDFVVVTNSELAKGYTDALDTIAMNYMEVYGNHGVDPFFGLHEPASMIAEVAANKYATTRPNQNVINLKTGINYNPELIEKIVQYA